MSKTKSPNQGNKVHGDDLEEIIPGKNTERVRRGAETFDIEGERISRVNSGRRNKSGTEDEESEDVERSSDRGAETFDIEGEMQRPMSDNDDDDDGTEPTNKSGAV